MNGETSNAVAGPSNPPLPTTAHMSPPTTSSYTPPLLFLPPPPPPPPKQHLASTQDLLARFHLLPAYDRYVRPFTLPGDDPALQQQPNDPQTPAPGISASASTPGRSGGPVDKGKGRERDSLSAVATPADADPLDAGDADDDDAPGAKGEKKKKNTYRHLIKGIPGKHSLKKDDYLTKMMLVPPKQRMRISQFDAKTQEDAFTVSLEGLKGWNVNALLLESAQAREDRKKRKELKRLAKLQGQHGGSVPTPANFLPAAATSLPSTAALSQPPIQAPIPRKMSASQGQGVPRSGVGTPRPGSRAGGSGGGLPRSTPTVPKPITVAATVVKPGGVPMPGSRSQQPVQGTPARMGTPMDVDPSSLHRGKKREREDVMNGLVHPNPNPYAAVNGAGVNGGYVNGNGISAPAKNVAPAQQQQQQPRLGVVNAKAGTGNIHPRPVKKQRMDMQGQARDVTGPVQQQPTPQGV